MQESLNIKLLDVTPIDHFRNEFLVTILSMSPTRLSIWKSTVNC